MRRERRRTRTRRRRRIQRGCLVAVTLAVSPSPHVSRVQEALLLLRCHRFDPIFDGRSSSAVGARLPSRTDPKTVAWLQTNFDPIFGFPNVARFSWAPVKNALLKKGVASKWCVPFLFGEWFVLRPKGISSTILESSNIDTKIVIVSADSIVPVRRNDEPATIQKYFAPDAAAKGGPAAAQAPLWKDLNLVSVGDL